MLSIVEIVNEIEAFANQFVGVDPKLHHPDERARLHGTGMLVDREIIRRMEKINERESKTGNN